MSDVCLHVSKVVFTWALWTCEQGGEPSSREPGVEGASELDAKENQQIADTIKSYSGAIRHSWFNKRIRYQRCCRNYSYGLSLYNYNYFYIIHVIV